CGSWTSANVTAAPAGLNTLQVDVSAPGRPSSVTVPASVAVVTGSTRCWSGPASTVGAAFAADTSTVTSSLAESCESIAVRRSTWVPVALNVAVVWAEPVGLNDTVPGPLTFDQLTASVPLGRPSSVALPFNTAVPGGKSTAWSEPALTTGGRFAL